MVKISTVLVLIFMLITLSVIIFSTYLPNSSTAYVTYNGNKINGTFYATSLIICNIGSLNSFNATGWSIPQLNITQNLGGLGCVWRSRGYGNTWGLACSDSTCHFKERLMAINAPFKMAFYLPKINKVFVSNASSNDNGTGYVYNYNVKLYSDGTTTIDPVSPLIPYWLLFLLGITASLVFIVKFEKNIVPGFKEYIEQLLHPETIINQSKSISDTLRFYYKTAVISFVAVVFLKGLKLLFDNYPYFNSASGFNATMFSYASFVSSTFVIFLFFPVTYIFLSSALCDFFGRVLVDFKESFKTTFTAVTYGSTPIILLFSLGLILFNLFYFAVLVSSIIYTMHLISSGQKISIIKTIFVTLPILLITTFLFVISLILVGIWKIYFGR